MPADQSNGPDRPPKTGGTIVKRYRKRDQQYIYGLRIRAYGQR
jgi:hypothetical protein